MWDRLSAFLFANAGRAEAGGHTDEELHMAAAGLLAAAALLDGHFDAAERRHIADVIESRFGLAREAAETLVEEARRRAEEAADFYAFLRVLARRFDHAEQVRLIEMLWEVAYADGELHDLEANLIRRITGLLAVSDRESGAARKRVRARLARS